MQQEFANFVEAREQIRLLRAVGDPFTPADEILRNYTFCNVNREHDAVTLWIHRNVRLRYSSTTSPSTMVRMMLVCRIFNEPETLKHLFGTRGLLPNPLHILSKLRAEGKTLFRGAYMMPAHGKAGRGRSTEEYYVNAVDQCAKLDFNKDTTLEAVAEKLLTLPGVGAFLANQVCADLRYVPALKGRWSDWTTFVLAGPGSRRGLARYLSLGLDTMYKQAFYTEMLLNIREEEREFLSLNTQEHFRDINNLSNCFCEFDKYQRARQQLADNKRITLRKFKYIFAN